MPTRTTPTDAIALLKEDHKKVREMLAKLDKSQQSAGESRSKLLERIQQELQMHTTIEEEIFYPAYRAAVSKHEDAKLYQEAIEEHHVVDTVLAEIGESDPTSEEFSGKAKVLKDLVEHHAGEEEKQMFPRARRAMEADKLKELGTQMAARKRELQEAEEGWLPTAGKLLAAVASRATPSSLRSRSASAPAQGAKRAKPAKTKTKSRARTSASAKPKTKTRARSRSRSAK